MNKYFGDFSGIVPDSPTAVGTAEHHNDILSATSSAYNLVHEDLTIRRADLINSLDWWSSPTGVLVNQEDFSAHAYRVGCMEFVVNVQGVELLGPGKIAGGEYSCLANTVEMSQRVATEVGTFPVKADGEESVEVSLTSIREELKSTTVNTGENYTDRYGNWANGITPSLLQLRSEAAKDTAKKLRDSAKLIADYSENVSPTPLYRELFRNGRNILIAGTAFDKSSFCALSGKDTTYPYMKEVPSGVGLVGPKGLMLPKANTNIISGIQEPCDFTDPSWYIPGLPPVVTASQSVNPLESTQAWQISQNELDTDFTVAAGTTSFYLRFLATSSEPAASFSVGIVWSIGNGYQSLYVPQLTKTVLSWDEYARTIYFPSALTADASCTLFLNFNDVATTIYAIQVFDDYTSVLTTTKIKDITTATVTKSTEAPSFGDSDFTVIVNGTHNNLLAETVFSFTDKTNELLSIKKSMGSNEFYLYSDGVMLNSGQSIINNISSQGPALVVTGFYNPTTGLTRLFFGQPEGYHDLGYHDLRSVNGAYTMVFGEGMNTLTDISLYNAAIMPDCGGIYN